MVREKRGRVVWRALAPVLIVLALILTACGSSSPVTSAIDFRSPAVEDGVTQPSTHCGWGSIWVPVEWGDVPADTKELAVYIGRYKYVSEGGSRKLVVPFGELVSHIKPSVRQVPPTVLPDGASWSKVGSVSCPIAANGQRLLIGLFALDRIQERTMTRSLAMQLTQEALKDPHPTEHPRSPGALTRDAAAASWFTTTYTSPH
jgi:hypothetical protein